MQNRKIDPKNGKSYPIAKATLIAQVLPCVAGASISQQEHACENMKGQGFTEGMIESISRSNDSFPLRIWIVDNSGSMNTKDGHKIHQTSDNHLLLQNCTRWAEIQNTVSYHAQIASLLEAPTSFRLLNPTYHIEKFSVAERGSEHISEDLRIALKNIRDISPSGATPLSERVQEIQFTVESMKDQLVAKNQKVVIVLATDGLPSNRYGETSQLQLNEFKQALRSLERLPIWLVIRLCTDDDKVVDFYNNIDNELELSIDILDDFVAEAKEVFEHNKWLNYALPLHRMREMGFYHRLFDLIDERPLDKGELVDFFYLIYGADAMDGIPNPQLDWPGFLDRIAYLTKKEKLQWNPIKKRMMPLVDIRSLDNKFGKLPTCSFWLANLKFILLNGKSQI